MVGKEGAWSLASPRRRGVSWTLQVQEEDCAFYSPFEKQLPACSWALTTGHQLAETLEFPSLAGFVPFFL